MAIGDQIFFLNPQKSNKNDQDSNMLHDYSQAIDILIVYTNKDIKQVPALH